jgi:hypothetical protein
LVLDRINHWGCTSTASSPDEHHPPYLYLPNLQSGHLGINHVVPHLFDKDDRFEPTTDWPIIIRT